MTPDDVDILVLRSGPHGMPSEDYARELSQRLPDANVFHAATPEAERAAIKFARVVTSTRISTALLDQADNLELFAGAAAGYDHLPLDTFREMGVTVTNASGVHGPNIAEQVLGFVLMFTRRLDEAVRRSQRGEWRHFQAHELAGSTVTVVGLGAIGTAVLDRLDGPTIEIDRGAESETDAEDHTMEWAARQAFERAGETPAAVYDRGAVGKEAMTRVLAPDVESAVTRVTALATAVADG